MKILMDEHEKVTKELKKQNTQLLKQNEQLKKKRKGSTADHVDSIVLLVWYYKDNGWGESAKRPRCVMEWMTW